MFLTILLCFFFFNDTATTEIYTLSLHDALPISVSTLLLGLLLLVLGPHAADAVGRAGREAVGASIGWGAALMFGLPVAGFLLLVSLVGIPFGIGLLLGLALLYSIGYVEAAWVLGRVMVHPPRHGGPRRLA